jgi:hypothetical protein
LRHRREEQEGFWHTEVIFEEWRGQVGSEGKEESGWGGWELLGAVERWMGQYYILIVGSFSLKNNFNCRENKFQKIFEIIIPLKLQYSRANEEGIPV